MNQTLLALLGMMIAMLFSLNQQRGTLHDYQTMVHDDMELMAAGVAQQVMETVASYPFDRATAYPEYRDADFKVSEMAAMPFPTGRRFQDALALEDFNDIQTRDVDFQSGDVTFAFTVDISVNYVDAAMQPSAVPTDTKVVLVTVNHPRYQEPLVLLSRSFSPGSSRS